MLAGPAELNGRRLITGNTLRSQPMNRSVILDILRGVAILLVVGRHYEYPGLAYRVGWCGVDLSSCCPAS